ncbi:MAG: hypothetical protein HQL48_11550 [Gammaproteobacteria bacterium]|nr:hypothetical protein [Gammaproteobacteria bacterium]
MSESDGFYGELQRIVIELKILRGDLNTVILKGVEQTAAYADGCGATEAHLVIFNRDPEVSWDERLWHQQQLHGRYTIDIWGC